jgi:hypothetical protein
MEVVQQAIISFAKEHNIVLVEKIPGRRQRGIPSKL